MPSRCPFWEVEGILGWLLLPLLMSGCDHKPQELTDTFVPCVDHVEITDCGPDGKCIRSRHKLPIIMEKGHRYIDSDEIPYCIEFVSGKPNETPEAKVRQQ
jgi:hypothetical protein